MVIDRVLADLARYLFWVHLREVVDPDDPEVVRALATIGGRARALRRANGLAQLRDALRRTFPALGANEGALERAVLTADEARIQAHLEELFLSRLDARRVAALVRLDGEAHLVAARAQGRGAVLVFPHAGAVQLLVARLGFAGFPVVHVSHGAAPAEPRDPGDGWPTRRIRAVREAAEDRLPVQVLRRDDDRAIAEALGNNDVVAVAFDGRGDDVLEPAVWLGRPATLSPRPWRWAAAAGAPVVPAVVWREADKSRRLTLGPPIGPADAATLRDAALAWMGHGLQAHPEDYGPWLAHCARVGRPLFADEVTASAGTPRGRRARPR